MDFSSKVAIVTGAAKGIGQAIAEILALRGAHVLITYNSSSAIAEETAANITAKGGTVSILKADISKMEDVVRIFDTCIERYGRPDILVANAAYMTEEMYGLKDVTEQRYYNMFDVNVKGTLFCIKEAGEKMKDNGRIIVISSSTVKFPVEGLLLYTASKAALHSIVEVTARELAPRGITVNSLLPGVTATKHALDGLPEEFVKAVRDSTPFGRVGEPKDVAEAVVMLAGDDSGWVSGQHIVANGAGRF